jgi:hypothetical protein
MGHKSVVDTEHAVSKQAMKIRLFTEQVESTRGGASEEINASS